MALVYAGNVSVLQSLFAQNLARNPATGGTGTSAFIANNLVFNWGEGATTLNHGYGGPEEEGPVMVTLRGNHYRHPEPSLLYTAALVTIGGFIIHLYMGLAVVPEGLSAMLHGEVSEKWARHHHRLWADEMKRGAPSSTHGDARR